MIPVSRPDVGIAELREIAEALETGWIGFGPKVDEFESEFGDRYEYENVIATNAGTSALDLAIKASDLSGTEILVPPITWISTAHVARYNDYEVGFVDVDPETLNMDPSVLADRISEQTAAVIPVHYGGQPVEIPEIVEIAHAHDAVVIEDAAHAVGATYEDEFIGTTGDVGCFSFQATKPLTTGEGGALVTDDDELARTARRLSKLGVDKSTHERSDDEGYDWYYEVTHVGYKYFMHDISAAMGLVQLERQPDLRAKRHAVADRYDNAFERIEETTPLRTKDHVTHARYNYTMRVPATERDALIAHLNERDIGASVHYMPLYKHPVFERHDPDLPTTETVWEELVTIPMSPTLTPAEVDSVISAVESYE
ncbi:DegT/DnrJ/EryC1/StrS family aminotransferase [Salinibaculum rarum]|uniref:DegT/DnrJ/EryC1/StrS family aminotransferase n=1 Tax=Salinibaculum rarum TaxID=3058903 RepID=UPI00265F9404|nr:DegT/DnrJ/EryC1/StrS aminotransferase family protein [Salinibaculum sp. KK48]